MHFVWPKTKNSADTICRTMSLADGWPSRQVHSMWRVRIRGCQAAAARKKELRLNFSTVREAAREQGRGRAHPQGVGAVTKRDWGERGDRGWRCRESDEEWDDCEAGSQVHHGSRLSASSQRNFFSHISKRLRVGLKGVGARVQQKGSEKRERQLNRADPRFVLLPAALIPPSAPATTPRPSWAAAGPTRPLRVLGSRRRPRPTRRWRRRR